MLLLRVDAPLYFANVNPVKDALYKYERRAKEIAAASGRSLHFIIIDLSPVNDIDASAVHFFKVSLGASLVMCCTCVQGSKCHLFMLAPLCGLQQSCHPHVSPRSTRDATLTAVLGAALHCAIHVATAEKSYFCATSMHGQGIRWVDNIT